MGAMVRGLGREWEWEREMGLEGKEAAVVTAVERRRREREGIWGRRRRPRWWQVSGEAMAAAVVEEMGREVGFQWMDGGDGVGQGSIGFGKWRK